jgi:hypothetical protein
MTHSLPAMPDQTRRCRSDLSNEIQGSGRPGSAGLLAAGPSGAASASERGAP